MPAEGVPLTPKPELLQDEEILRLANCFVRLGVQKIRFTGGEPLIRKNALDLIAKISQIVGLEGTALTTNGLLLSSALPELKKIGLQSLNISLDTLKSDRFFEITRRKGLNTVLSAIDLALALGFRPKINVVVMKGVNEDEVLSFAEWTKEVPLSVRFIEFMPFDGNRWSDNRLVGFAEMKRQVEESYDLQPLTNQPSDTAKSFKIPNAKGDIGFIASMTAPFCAGCNRLRLGANGLFKACLFAKPTLNLATALRNGATDEQIEQLVRSSLFQKKAQHDGMYDIAHQENQPMILIGG